MGLDLEFARKSTVYSTYEGQSKLGSAFHRLRGFLKNAALDESFHTDGMRKAIMRGLAVFLTTGQTQQRYVKYHRDLALW